MYKIIALVKRKRGLAVEAFQTYWRDVHGPLVAAGPGLRRYVQSHALIQGYAKGELLFDGISELWFDSAAAFSDFRGSAQFAKAIEDEPAFAEAARTVVFPVDVHVIKDGPVPAGAVKNVEFVNRRPGMALEPFFAYWRNVHGPLASHIALMRRYEQNHTAMAAYEGGAAPAYDGLAITWFDSTADMKRGTVTAEYAATRADEPNFLPDGHLPIIISREHVLLG